MTRIRSAVVVVGLALTGIAPAAAQPANDACATPIVITSLPFTHVVDVSAATAHPSDPTLRCSEDLDADTVWYAYTAPADEVLELSTAGSAYDTALAVYRGTCAALEPAGCSDDDIALDPASRLVFALAAGETVLILVAGDGNGGTLRLDVRQAAEAQPGLAGPEFLVNTYTPDDQGYYVFNDRTGVCADAGGDLVVVWESDGQDGSDAGVFGQRFAADGTPQGAEFQVNATTLDSQGTPAVDCGADGSFVVVWRDTSSGLVQARRYDAAGVPTTGEIAAAAGGSQPRVAVDAAGGFVVTWSSSGDIHARRFDAAGAPLGAAFQVNTYTTGAQGTPAIARTDTGEFMLVWESGFSDVDVRGRRLDATASPVGPDAVVNAYTTGHQVEPRIASLPAGGFVVSWVGDGASGYEGVQVRRFDGSGTPVAPEAQANVGEDVNIVSADVAADPAGNFIVVWDDYYNYRDALVRRFDASGAPVSGVEFRANTLTKFTQHAPHVAAQPSGDFVVVWTGYDGEDENGYFYGGYGVRAQRFRLAPAPPCPPAPRTGCKEPTIALKGRLTLKDKDADKSDSLGWKWVRGQATTLAEIGDPLGTDGYAVCVYDIDGLVLSAVVPAGGTCGTRPCWKSITDGFKFSDGTGAHGGIRTLLLRAGAEGAAKVVVRGKGEPLAMPPLPLDVPVTAQVSSTTGACWGADFQPAGVLANDAASFSGKAS